MDRRPRRVLRAIASPRTPYRRRTDLRVVGSAIVLLVLSTLLLVLGHAGAVSTTHGQGTSSNGRDRATPRHHLPDPPTLAVGVTHTQYSIDSWDDETANASARAVLTATASYQNQHIFGWGALNPQPSPGVFDWSSLDRRMELIRSTGGTPVITLCCAPDWMKGGRPGQTDWTRLEAAPSPEHYADFAALAAAVARRYRDVRHFQVWNELKGFWNQRLQRWNYEAYTTLYNAVYAAVKAVDPGIAVGGPYVVVDVWRNRGAGGYPSGLTGGCGTVDQRSLDVLDYWLLHKLGADFVAVDASLETRDAGPVTSASVSSWAFDVLTRWLRQRTSLPVWWSEFHVGRAGSDGQQKLVATALGALLHMADAGASVALVWQPQRDARVRGAHPPALWTPTNGAAGGRPLAYADALTRLREVLADPPGPDAVSWPAPAVGVVRSSHALFIVHLANGRVGLQAAGQSLNIGPYEVRYVPLPPGSPASGTPLPSGSTADTPSTTSADQCLRLAPRSSRLASPEASR
jgi:hypothetical protein